MLLEKQFLKCINCPVLFSSTLAIDHHRIKQLPLFRHIMFITNCFLTAHLLLSLLRKHSEFDLKISVLVDDGDLNKRFKITRLQIAT